MNVLILAAGPTEFNAHDGNYPLCLVELDGTPLIQRLMQACTTLEKVHFIVALRQQDIHNHHLDNIIRLLSPTANLVSIKGKTRGAACTALLAKGFIDNDEELLILDGNEILDAEFSTIINRFRTCELDAGVVSFSSVHPRYSYVRLNADHLVIEAAAKNPISRNAMVGFYWFARGKDFVHAAQSMIRKDASVNDSFYISPALNEILLQQARIGVFPIAASSYHPLKTERQLMQFESALDYRKPAE